MAAIQGRVVEVRPDEGCRYMDQISVKYTNAPFPSRGPDRVCFVIAVQSAAARTLGFVHQPGQPLDIANLCHDPRTGVMTRPPAASKLLTHEGRGRISPVS
jgi:hypothetical protein